MPRIIHTGFTEAGLGGWPGRLEAGNQVAGQAGRPVASCHQTLKILNKAYSKSMKLALQFLSNHIFSIIDPLLVIKHVLHGFWAQEIVMKGFVSF